MEREVRVETGYLDDAETVIVAFGSPAKFVKYAIKQLRADGHRIGYVRPITLWPFPYETVRDAATASACGASARSSCRAGQMIDDVRIGVAGQVPVTFIGGVSTDHSGFGVGPAARRRGHLANASSRCTEDEPLPPIPGYEQFTYALQPHQEQAVAMTTRTRCSTPSTAPLDGAAHRAQQAGTAAHPGAPHVPRLRRAARGAPVPRDDRGARPGRARDRASPGIGCYTSFSGTIDVDLVQALHGRAPSVATGVKRMLPDALVFTLQGDGDMVNEGLQEVLHTAARGESVTCILLNNGVFGETGGHMTAHERDRAAHEELARRPRRRVPRLPDPHRRPDRAAPGRGVRRPRLGAQRRRGRSHQEDVPACVRVAGAPARDSRSSRC